MARETGAGTKLPLAIENLDTATYKCVFPVCGGICCKNGRPGCEPDEIARIDAVLPRVLPLLRPGARKKVEQDGWLTNRVKEGKRMAAVEGGWCVFANEGCTLQKLGMADGQPWAYKPSVCVLFPLAKENGQWYVRQWNYRGEAWDLFCLNPKEDPTPASESLRDEIEYSAQLEAKKAEAVGRGARKKR